MTNEPKDRHVLAAAVTAKAEAVVTFNLRHFPNEACDPYGVEICAQAAALRRPPVSPLELLEMLERAGVPRFASSLRSDAPADD